jgi:sensor histidine kinase regulating citrate/malate metabolism
METGKEGLGRGVGTYSMKLFGEDVLGGTADCSSSEREGTIFSFRLPRLNT